MLLTLETRMGVMPREVPPPSAWRLRRWRAALEARTTGAASHLLQEESCALSSLRQRRCRSPTVSPAGEGPSPTAAGHARGGPERGPSLAGGVRHGRTPPSAPRSFARQAPEPRVLVVSPHTCSWGAMAVAVRAGGAGAASASSARRSRRTRWARQSESGGGSTGSTRRPRSWASRCVPCTTWRRRVRSRAGGSARW